MNKSDQKDLNRDMVDSAYLNTQDTSMIKKEKIFKNWLNDTIKKIDTGNYANVGKLNNIRKVFKVAPDSLGLSIITYYDCNIGSAYKTHDGNDLDNLLTLLKEYDEYPKNDFIINFNTSYNYYPSPVAGLSRDMIYKINSIEIKSLDGKNTSVYSFIRGRISYKDIVLINKSGDIERKRVEFVWKNGKLEKLPRSN